MSNILITGATGNMGSEVIKYLSKSKTTHKVIVGVRNLDKAKSALTDYPELEFVHFDFENVDTFDNALSGIDRIFLLRPPHISDIERFFKPLFNALKRQNVNELVFLSVQGAEKSKVIPHNKIERLVTEFGLEYIFLRPSYFMQNLTTTLISDIETKREIILPSGKAKFNWIDIENIAEIAAIFLEKFELNKNQVYEITGNENESFTHVTSLINRTVKSKIKYRSVNLFQFFWIKKRDGMEYGMILVMALLHFLPRFQKEPRISNTYQRLTGKNPTTLKAFITRVSSKLEAK